MAMERAVATGTEMVTKLFNDVNDMVQIPTECERATKILENFTVPPAIQEYGEIIPSDILHHCHGIAILSIVKVGMVWSGRIGSGIVIARLPDGSWSGPSAINTAGAGVGGQIGAQVSDVVMILNTKEAVGAFFSGGNVTLGSNVSVAAGPVGRSGEVSASVGAKGLAAVFSYSRSKGLFAGISVEGSTIFERTDVNRNFYGEGITAEMILTGQVQPPEDSLQWNIMNNFLIEKCSAPEPVESQVEPEDEDTADEDPSK